MGIAGLQRRHAKKRAFQRFGLVLNNTDLIELAEEIRAGKLERADYRPNTYIKHTWAGPVIVAYDPGTGQVATFLRPEWAELEDES